MTTGRFVISLDFELHWGGFEKWSQDAMKNYFLTTRATIPKILELFRRYETHATWAAVGMLFHRNKKELLEDFPPLLPAYKDQRLSPYRFIEEKGIGEDEESDPLHYGWSLLTGILDTPGQELGSHTFAHYYCNEPGQTVEQFRADIQAAQKAAQRLNTSLHSLVFPRNQFNEEYLRICRESGIIAVRSNPSDWFWNIESTANESLWTRLNRGADAYVPVGRTTSYHIESIRNQEELPLCIPASRLLRPYRSSELFLNEMKINRVASELMRAARLKHVYHLWWHPHNFGNYPVESLKGLEKILATFQYCRKEFGMKSMTMNELALEILEPHAKEAAA